MITIEQAREWFLKQDRTRKNPIVDGAAGLSCVYDDYKGNHCIAGQFLSDFGLSLPDVNHNVIRIYESPDAPSDWGAMSYFIAHALGTAQDAADEASIHAELFLISEPWGNGIDIALESLEDE